MIKVINQKKPKALLRAVWEQLVLEQEPGGPWAQSFASCAYDGRKNAYTPIAFPIGQSKLATEFRQTRTS